MRVTRYSLSILASMLILSSPALNDGRAEDNRAKGRVEATYSANWAGMNLGEFRVEADFNGSAYQMKAQGEFSVLAGLVYRASGTTTSAGKLTRSGPEPSRYTLSYKGGDKKETRRMDFNGGGAIDVSIVPKKKHNPLRRVPVTKAQLANALDPLTAAFLYARYNGPRGDLKVCHQTVPVYDGQQRFDIVLTPKRADRLDASKGPAGLSGPVAVCKVKFKPISGYRPDHPGIKFMSETEEIEVWLVPLPRTPLYVPYKIFVPTAWGQGVAALTEIRMKLDD